MFALAARGSGGATVANFDEALMSDIEALEQELVRTIDAAADDAGLEAVRVAALGKRGSISALLATLGKMSPGLASETRFTANIGSKAVHLRA